MDGDVRFEWDTHNITHLALHGIRPDQAEQVLAGDLVDLDYTVTRDGEERWAAVGQTLAGRIVVVVWTVPEDGSYRVVTAYPATKGLEAVYFRLTKG
jgi:hypothetical protein